MSILLNGTDQWAHRNTFPDQSLGWSMLAWARRDEAGSDQNIVAGTGSASAGQATIMVYENNRARFVHGVTAGFAGLWNVVEQWQLVFLTYTSTGTLRLRNAVAGDADWRADIGTVTGLTNLTPTNFMVGNGRPDIAASPFQGPIAVLKVWEGRILTDAEAWAEREYREPVSATDIWATYKFADSALETDFSAGARTLTLVGTPTYTADEPADILGDNAGGLTPAVISEVSKTATEVVIGITSYDATAASHNLYRSTSATPIDPTLATDRLAVGIDPLVNYTDSTVAASTTYYYTLASYPAV